jgi:hypothetical protein
MVACYQEVSRKESGAIKQFISFGVLDGEIYYSYRLMYFILIIIMQMIDI